jgi:ankyrin repeat domain-containing protein 13
LDATKLSDGLQAELNVDADNLDSSTRAMLESDMDSAMASDVSNVFFDEHAISLQRARSGFLAWRHDKTEEINGYTAAVFELKGPAFRTRKRREHLSEEDLKKNKESWLNFKNNTAATLARSLTSAREDMDATENLIEGADQAGAAADREDTTPHRPSLPAPPPLPISDPDVYFSQQHPDEWCIGRAIVQKEKIHDIAATVSMCENFPAKLEQILPILDILANTNAHAERIAQFLRLTLPPGFPMKIGVLISMACASMC